MQIITIVKATSRLHPRGTCRIYRHARGTCVIHSSIEIHVHCDAGLAVHVENNLRDKRILTMAQQYTRVHPSLHSLPSPGAHALRSFIQPPVVSCMYMLCCCGCTNGSFEHFLVNWLMQSTTLFICAQKHYIKNTTCDREQYTYKLGVQYTYWAVLSASGPLKLRPSPTWRAALE